MNDTIPKNDKEKIEIINDIVSAENNKSKYYECNNISCVVEISENNKDKQNKQESILNSKNAKPQKTEDNVFNNGEIIVTSILECGEHEYLKGVKINLYKINGLSPILIKSQITDEEGKVVFSEVEEGCYRIIEIIDKRYFEKPKYINWNEIIIDSVNSSQKIIIINKIKRFVTQAKYKH
jgi:5-hydroxyisourate hydrolase-like protein (transthyretin family)